MNYSIYTFKEIERIPELTALFKTGLGDTSVDHWKWRLFTPNGCEDVPFAVVAEDENGCLAGVSTAIPVYYGPEQKKCILFGDWVVHPQHRGQGLIRKIFGKICAYADDNGYEFMITFPNQNSYPILKKYGFIDLNGLSCWNTRNKLFFQKNRKASEHRFKDVVYRYSNRCPDIDIFVGNEGRIYKNKKFLEWKYDLNPDEKYTWLSLWKDGSCIGYFVYLLTKGRLRTAVNVYDWEFFGDNVEYFNRAVKMLQKEGNFVSFWGRYPINTQKIMEEAGLKDRHADIVCIVKPIGNGSVPELTLTRIDTDY